MASKYIALPKGISETTFDAAVKDFRRVLGEANVLTSAYQLAPYTKIMMPVPEANHTPSAAILATTVGQIQEIVGICNKHKIPVWTISTGKNLGYGSAAPAERGQVVLDLHRMNRILEVDADLCYALVEPGVTYRQLYDYFQEHKLPLWLSVPAPSAIAGPTGNTLDRGVGYTPLWRNISSMPAAWKSSWPMARSFARLWVACRTPIRGSVQPGYGPYLDGIFTQSNYGIVTKFGFWVMPAPPAYKPFQIQYQDEGDIVEIVETIRPLRISGTIPNSVVIAHALYEAGLKAKRSDYVSGPGSISDEAVHRLIRDHKMGLWNVYAALYGTAEQVDVNWKIVTEAFGKSGKAKFLTEQDVGDDPQFGYRAALMRGGMDLREFILTTGVAAAARCGLRRSLKRAAARRSSKWRSPSGSSPSTGSITQANSSSACGTCTISSTCCMTGRTRP